MIIPFIAISAVGWWIVISVWVSLAEPDWPALMWPWRLLVSAWNRIPHPHRRAPVVDYHRIAELETELGIRAPVTWAAATHITVNDAARREWESANAAREHADMVRRYRRVGIQEYSPEDLLHNSAVGHLASDCPDRHEGFKDRYAHGTYCTSAPSPPGDDNGHVYNGHRADACPKRVDISLMRDGPNTRFVHGNCERKELK